MKSAQDYISKLLGSTNFDFEIHPKRKEPTPIVPLPTAEPNRMRHSVSDPAKELGVPSLKEESELDNRTESEV